jgi:tetratricopeptide (TPR) repeat protein
MASPSMTGMHALAKVRDLVHRGSFDEALELCELGATSHPDQATEFVMLAGHASLGKQVFGDALKAYRKVLESMQCSPPSFTSGVALEAWNGILQVYRIQNNVQGQVEALEHVLKLTPEDDPGDAVMRIDLAELYAEIGEHEKSQQLFWHVIGGMPIGSEERLDCLCKMADSMLKQKETHVESQVELKAKEIRGSIESDPNVDPSHAEDSREKDVATSLSCIKLDLMAAQAAQDDEDHQVGVSLNHVLTEIIETSPASLKYLPYREEYLRRCLLRIFHHPPRSTERQQYRLAALRECVKIICTGGQCSSFAFEAAVWLLEEEEEVSGGGGGGGGQEGTNTVAFAVENFARRMYHQFPCNPTAKTLLVMMMRRRSCSRSRADRLVFERMLEDAMEEDDTVDCASGFRALAELHYENRHYEKAHDVSLRGLRWLQERRERGHESLSQVGLGLRLVLAKSLRRLGRLDEAEAQFKALAGWVSEGEIGFGELCGSAPTSIHQQSLRGIALVAVERGDVDAAMSQYERILGKACLGRAKEEHWAHADYGWLLYQRGAPGDMDQARIQLEKAIEVAEEDCNSATDSQLAEHRYRLGEVYWKLKDVPDSKKLAYAQFYDSAKVESHHQAAAVAALGRYYEEVEGNRQRPSGVTRKPSA